MLIWMALYLYCFVACDERYARIFAIRWRHSSIFGVWQAQTQVRVSLALGLDSAFNYVVFTHFWHTTGAETRVHSAVVWHRRIDEMKWNEKCNDLKCVQKPTQSRLSLTHHANKSSRWADKNIRWSESLWNQSGRKGKGLWRKWFAEEPSL